MFDGITRSLGDALKRLRGRGRITEANIRDGLEEVRKARGYHDEPLKGHRAGQRSIRLSSSYRAIYEIKKDTVEFVSVEEVSKHDY